MAAVVVYGSGGGIWIRIGGGIWIRIERWRISNGGRRQGDDDGAAAA